MIVFDPAKTALFEPSRLDFGDANPAIAVFVFDDDHYERLLTRSDLKVVKTPRGFDNGQRILTYKNHEILISNGNTGGAPACAMELEMLIASGVHSVVAFGTSGALDKSLGSAEIIVPSAAIRDEGTSYHYLEGTDGIDEISQNLVNLQILKQELTNHSLPFQEGKVWTTDAIYRETKMKTNLMKSHGCVVVDMECSALLAVAQFRNINFVQFLLTYDNLDKLDQPTDVELYLNNYNDKVLDVALETAIKMSLTNIKEDNI